MSQFSRAQLRSMKGFLSSMYLSLYSADAQMHSFAFKFALCLVLLSGALIFTPASFAADITLSDTCSLKNAIIAANTDTATSGCSAGSGADTIIIRGNITLTSTTAVADGYSVSTTMTIEGRAGSGTSNQLRVINADNSSAASNRRIFDVTAAGNLTVKYLNLQNGAHATGGGAIQSAGALTAENSRFNGNTCRSVTSCRGGGIYISGGSATINDSIFSDNLNPAVIGRGGAIQNTGTMNIARSTFNNNRTTDRAVSGETGGGAIHNGGTLTISASSFEGNSNYHGGAIKNSGTLTISGSSFKNNRAALSANLSGGAINSTTGALTIRKSYFEGNSATGSGGAIRSGSGALTIENSTFSGNSVSGAGGAVQISTAGNSTLRHNTLVGNSAGTGKAINYSSSSSGTNVVANSILAGSGVLCNKGAGVTVTLTSNIFQDGSCGATATDPKLGGRTGSGAGTHYPPRIDSPAVNTADATQCGNLNNPDDDQLGTTRPRPRPLPGLDTIINICDIGSIELPLAGAPAPDYSIRLDANDAELVHFDASASTDGDPNFNLPLTYEWDYSYSTSDGFQIDHSTGQPKHSHRLRNGLHRVRLRVKTLAGSGAKRYVIRTYAKPSASFSAAVDANNPLKWTFTPGSTHYVSLLWEFGNGGTNRVHTLNPVSRTYASAGRYDVTLTVRNNAGGEARATQSIAAGISPSSDFSISGSGLDAVLSARAGGGDVTYAWDVDGSSYSSRVVEHTFASAGSYSVTLTTSNASGSLGPRTQRVTVPISARRPRGDSDDDGGGDGDDEQDEAAEASKPQPATCAELPAGIVVTATYGLRSGIHCQHVAPSITQLPDALNAVDVWAYVEQGAEVCFQGVGAIQFLDAALSPRALHTLDAYSLDGMTCAEIDRPGTVVLIYSDQPAPPRPQPLSGQDAPGEQPRALHNCMVTTTDTLYFRQAPGGGLIIRDWIPNSWLPKNATLTALARTSNWFKVDFYGVQGWISAHYATPHGTCG